MANAFLRFFYFFRAADYIDRETERDRDRERFLFVELEGQR